LYILYFFHKYSITKKLNKRCKHVRFYAAMFKRCLFKQMQCALCKSS